MPNIEASIYQERDIKFGQLTSTSFEELSYDLLLKFQFHSLIWRQGGADKGRDIEAKRTINDAMVNPFDEKWFVECKRRENVKVGNLSEKVEWAKAERANHLLIIVSSYLTQGTREWLKKIGANVPFKIHVIEGKLLKKILLKFPDLLLKYFGGDHVELIQEMARQWTIHDILPEPKALYALYNNLDLGKLSSLQLAFLWFAFAHKSEELDEFCRSQDLPEIFQESIIPFPELVPFLKANATSSYPIMGKAIKDKFEIGNPIGVAWSQEAREGFFFASVHLKISKTERLQAVLIRDKKQLDVYIALGKNNKGWGW